VEAYEAIIGKRDRREFDERTMPDDVLRRILQAGRMAGSSGNKQPIRLIVLQDRENIRRLGAASRTGQVLERAPLGVVILLQKGARDFDVGRVAQNMMVAAWAEGVASCPVGYEDPERCRPLLGVPDDFDVSMAVAFGYPASNPTPRASRPRLPLEEMVHYERW
jgi:nitroreductase